MSINPRDPAVITQQERTRNIYALSTDENEWMNPHGWMEGVDKFCFLSGGGGGSARNSNDSNASRGWGFKRAQKVPSGSLQMYSEREKERCHGWMD